VTIQAQILDLMRDLQRESNTAVVFITHDLGVVAEMADRVAVMYAGEIVEEADVHTLFTDPKHPYTQGLSGSIPILGEVKENSRRSRAWSRHWWTCPRVPLRLPVQGSDRTRTHHLHRGLTSAPTGRRRPHGEVLAVHDESDVAGAGP
jgi:ABC-type glutathione transport system ATPase component